MNQVNLLSKKTLFFVLFLSSLIGIFVVFKNHEIDVMAANKFHFKAIRDIPKEKWELLGDQKIFFGHQSVGKNIVDGVKALSAENSAINLTILETSKLSTLNNSAWFAHSMIGENKDPYSKIIAFSNVLEHGGGNTADIVFFKFCYVDITFESNIDAIFSNYRKTMEKLQQLFGDTRIIHVTVPLRKVQDGPKAFIKKIIGRPIDEYAENIKRNEYNKFLRDYYKTNLFDLARFESTKQDGTRQMFTLNGKSYYSLVPEYTLDKGHLNEIGRRYVAEQLLIFLATLEE